MSAVGANVSISHSLIGARVRLYPGVRIGQDGFGFAMGPSGFVKVPQLGRVIIDDDVEIGANTTIDRGAGPDTVIGAGTMIDNLVQIGHNVQVGRGCVLIAQVGHRRQHAARRSCDHRRARRAWRAISPSAAAPASARRQVSCAMSRRARVWWVRPAVPVKEFFRQVATLQRLSRKKGE